LALCASVAKPRSDQNRTKSILEAIAVYSPRHEVCPLQRTDFKHPTSPLWLRVRRSLFEARIFANRIPDRIAAQAGSGEISVGGRNVDHFLDCFECKICVAEMRINLGQIGDIVIFPGQGGCFAGRSVRFSDLAACSCVSITLPASS